MIYHKKMYLFKSVLIFEEALLKLVVLGKALNYPIK